MSRDLESIKAGVARAATAVTESQVTNYPHGHFVGFYLDIQGEQLVVGPGEANVHGTAVRLLATTPVEENAWAIPRERDKIYYLYLRRDGRFWVDNQDPTWEAIWNGWYHPVTGYRFLGHFYNDDTGKIIYKLSTHYDTGTQVICGCKGYVGYCDYELDEDHDEVEINKALKYVSASAQAKEVVIRGGTAKVQAAIEMRSNTGLVGDGATIEKNCNDYAIECIGTSVVHKENVYIRDLTITRNAADTNDVAMVYLYYADDVLISECAFSGGYHAVEGSFISGIFSDNNLSADVVGTWRGFNVDNCDNLSITGNHFKDIRAGVTVSCIKSISGTNCEVKNNSILRVHGGAYGVGSTAGMYISSASSVTVSGNTIRDCYSLSGGGYGIYLNAGTSNVILGNHCLDNGNLIYHGNCEATGAGNYPHLDGEAANSATNCTPSRVSTPTPYSGTYCLKLNKDTAGSGGTARYYFHDHDYTVTNDMAGLVPGCSYTLSLQLYCPSTVATANAVIRFSYYDSGAWTDSDVSPTTQDAWEEITTTVAIPATATGVRVYARIDTAEAQNDAIYLDHLRIRLDGVGNSHGHNFYNTGTGTLTNGNTWTL